MVLVYCCSLDGLIASIVLLICTSLWIKASAKWLNVNVNVNVPVLCSREERSPERVFLKHGDILWSRSRITRCYDCVTWRPKIPNSKLVSVKSLLHNKPRQMIRRLWRGHLLYLLEMSFYLPIREYSRVCYKITSIKTNSCNNID